MAGCLLVLGALVMLWLVLINAMCGIYLHQLYVRERIARKWPVQAYDPALDEAKADEAKAEDVAEQGQPEAPSHAALPGQVHMTEA